MTKSGYVIFKKNTILIRKVSFSLIGFMMLLILSAFDQIQPPTPIPTASIAISTPSTGSMVISPIKLEAKITCDPGEILRIELTNKQERLLFRKLIIQDCQSNIPFELKQLIYFDAPAGNTTTRLSISLIDHDNVLRAIASSELVLSQDNSSIITAKDNQSNIIIISPLENTLLSHGKFPVKGWIRPLDQTPVIFELFSDTGGLISSRQISIPEDNAGEYFFFDINIPFTIPRIRNAILIIRQMGSTIPGNIALESFTFQISP